MAVWGERGGGRGGGFGSTAEFGRDLGKSNNCNPGKSNNCNLKKAVLISGKRIVGRGQPFR